MDGPRFDRLARRLGGIRRHTPDRAEVLPAAGPDTANSPLDRLARFLAAGATRRATLAGLAVALLPRFAGDAAARPRATCRRLGRVCVPARGLGCCPGATCRDGRCRCRHGRRRCGRDCIPASRCCRNRCGGGATCRNGRCGCPGSRRRCRSRCIPKAACCRDRECGPGEECHRGRCRCRRGATTCRRDCIGTAAELTAALAAGPDVLRLCPNTVYQGSFSIGRSVTILGAGVGSTVLDGGGTDLVVEVAAGVAAALHGLTIRNGNAERGGGIFNHGALALADVALSGNRATYGGAIYNDELATLALLRCRIITNDVTNFGGGIFTIGSATLTGCTLTGNTAAINGGAIDSSAPALTLDACRLSGNTATQQGGAILSTDGILTLRNGTRVGPGNASETANQAAFGAGIAILGDQTSLILDASHVTGNVAISRGVGGIYANGAGLLFDLGNGSTVQDNTPCDCNFADAACAVTCT